MFFYVDKKQEAEQVVTQADVAVEINDKLRKLNDAIDQHPTVENYEKRLSEYFLMGRYRDAMNDALAMTKLQPDKGKVHIEAIHFFRVYLTCELLLLLAIFPVGCHAGERGIV